MTETTESTTDDCELEADILAAADDLVEEMETEETESEWEVCIRAYGPDDPPGEARWEHYHPTAPDKDTATEQAIEQAKTGLNSLIGMTDSYDIVEVAGPFDTEEP